MAATDATPLHSFWLVMDFEATCDGDRSWKNEIIEWPCLLVSADTHRVIDEFRSMVRPTERPVLTRFCTTLTSIEQCDVDHAPTLEEVLVLFDTWLASHGVDEAGAVSVWCGDWDLNTCLPNECRRKGLTNLVPPVLREWCNLKVPLREEIGKVKGMGHAMNRLGLELTGHVHLGIDDARNIAKIVCELARRRGNGVVTATSYAPDKTIYRRRRRLKSSVPAATESTDDKSTVVEGDT